MMTAWLIAWLIFVIWVSISNNYYIKDLQNDISNLERKLDSMENLLESISRSIENKWYDYSDIPNNDWF